MRVVTVRIGLGNFLRARMVESFPEAARGLSSEYYLGDDQGMVFPSSVVGQYPTLVFDQTNIPLDVLWISGGRISGVERNVQPHSAGGVRPVNPIDYALELRGGYVSDRGIALGDPVLLS